MPRAHPQLANILSTSATGGGALPDNLKDALQGQGGLPGLPGLQPGGVDGTSERAEGGDVSTKAAAEALSQLHISPESRVEGKSGSKGGSATLLPPGVGAAAPAAPSAPVGVPSAAPAATSYGGGSSTVLTQQMEADPAVEPLLIFDQTQGAPRAQKEFLHLIIRACSCHRRPLTFNLTRASRPAHLALVLGFLRTLYQVA